jgi:hypothetical protein
MSEPNDHLPDRPEPPEPRGGTPDLTPAEPEQEGVREEAPDQMQYEAARMLANDAKPRLHGQGFDDDQIRAWASTYVAEFGSGSVDEFLAWIDAEQR